jgi:hypothetical protein
VLPKFTGVVLFGVFCLAPLRSSAQALALVAVADPSQLSEVQLAKVMAEDSSLWLSVRLQGRSRLALVTAESSVESAPAADAWLRALDFATRVRVAAPAGPLAGCGSLTHFPPVDTGLPEARRVAAFEVSSVTSEIELRRGLAEAGLEADISRIAEFTSAARPPFRIALYDVPAFGGSTEALRLLDRGHSEKLPRIVVSSSGAVSLSLIILANDGVEPVAQESADPSELLLAYRAVDASCDYSSARRGWLGENPGRWLKEVQASPALFSSTRLSASDPIESAISHYLAHASESSASACEARIRAAHTRASRNGDDFACDGADDLSRTSSELDFAEVRLSRFYGMLSDDDTNFRVASGQSRGPLLQATDFDPSGCPTNVSVPSSGPAAPSQPPPPNKAPVLVSAPEDPYYATAPSTPAESSREGSCAVSVFDSGSDGSCSGDSTSSQSSGDSCSGDSSSEDTGSDSCSGDGQDSSSESCSGDSDSSSDSAGCGKSEYDGDTCSGDSADASSSKTKSAELHAPSRASRPRPPPRRVRLSLLTLLAAALALPLRRLLASR